VQYCQHGSATSCGWERRISKEKNLGEEREREEGAIWCMVEVLTKFPMCKTRIARLEDLQLKGRERELMVLKKGDCPKFGVDIFLMCSLKKREEKDIFHLKRSSWPNKVWWIRYCWRRVHGGAR
jgi:hypothetical protein